MALNTARLLLLSLPPSSLFPLNPYSSSSSSSFCFFLSPFSAMNQFIKVITPKNLSPKRLFRSKKDRSMVSRSDPSSYSCGSFDSSVSNHKADSRAEIGTPTSVLPEIAGDWSDSSSDTYSDLVQAFKLMDRDNDGIVSRSHLEALLFRLGGEPPTEEEVAIMLSEVDHGGDGCISVEALMNKLCSSCEPAGDDELKVAFEFFDTDHDGKITAEELLGVYRAIGDDRCTLDDCRRMIAVVDKNGDGFVCFEDFTRMMELRR